MGVEPTSSPAPRFAIRSHAAKRVEVNLNPGVAIWSLAIKRPVVILPLYNNYRLCQGLSLVFLEFFIGTQFAVPNRRKSLCGKSLRPCGAAAFALNSYEQRT